ncbi:MAG: hypothetical protein DRQ49_14350 [Gammaproteobacteria bacterium]|nr:MAG: hypothetical protein DRQ49_14350 [Gammaproteobacteria bacterium]RKZ76362.1 MAG: hypothetical protein DRQ57_04050 [Gammaproteobacteria bacterium]
MKTYIIGRSQNADIVITNADQSVSAFHLELTEDSNGKYFVTDRKSANGTYRKYGGRWIAIQETYVSLNEQLLLGKYQVTIRELLAMRLKQVPPVKNLYNRGNYSTEML